MSWQLSFPNLVSSIINTLRQQYPLWQSVSNIHCVKFFLCSSILMATMFAAANAVMVCLIPSIKYSLLSLNITFLKELIYELSILTIFKWCLAAKEQQLYDWFLEFRRDKEAIKLTREDESWKKRWSGRNLSKIS